MIMIFKQITITPIRGSMQTLQTLLTELASAALTEKGCEMFSLFRADDDRYIIMANWKDEKSFHAHKTSEHYLRFIRNSAELLTSQKSLLLEPLEIKPPDNRHPLDKLYDTAYDTSLSIPFAGPTTKKILDQVHMREVGKGFMVGFKPFYPRRTFDFIAKQGKKLSKPKKS